MLFRSVWTSNYQSQKKNKTWQTIKGSKDHSYSYKLYLNLMKRRKTLQDQEEVSEEVALRDSRLRKANKNRKQRQLLNLIE